MGREARFRKDLSMQKACCPLFRAALARKQRAKHFREDFRSMFTTCLLPDWNTFHRALAFGHRAPVPVPLNDTSQPRSRAEAARTALVLRGRHRRPHHPEAPGGWRLPIVLRATPRNELDQPRAP